MSKRKLAISTVIIAYLAVVCFELIPPSPLSDRLYAPFKPAILYAGLWQTFAVFVPNPRKNNIYLDALVIFDDGTTQVWTYPRMEQLGLVERIQKERYRKYGHDHVYFQNEKVLWPDLARYVARLLRTTGKRPVLVQLRRHWSDIPAPASILPAGAVAATYGSIGQETFLEYHVEPKDLQ